MRAALVACLLILGACAGATPGFSLDGGERACSGPYQLDVTDSYGNQLPTFERYGRSYVLGEEGERYRLRIRNRSGRRIEAVVAVDGRDAVDGRPARWEKTGYVIAPHSDIVIEGFRLNMRDVATFRFSSVGRSYAAQMGDARQVGVIGVAIFTEQPVPIRRPQLRDPYPWDDYGGGRGRDESKREESESGATSTQDRPSPSSPPAATGAARGKAGAQEQAPADRRSQNADRDAERPGLGTEFGERRSSRVYTVDFRRAHRRPDAVLAVRYNDRDGLLALGIRLERRQWPDQEEVWRRETAQPFGNVPTFAPPPPGWR